MTRRLALVFVVLALGCGEAAEDERPETPATPDETVPRVVPEETAPIAPETPLVGLEGLEAPPTEAELTPTTELSTSTPTGSHACVLASETRSVLPHAGRTAIVAGYLGQLFVAAYVHDEGEAVAVVRVTPTGAPELVTRIPLTSPVPETARMAPPGLFAIDTSTLLLAATDGEGRLLYTEIDMALGAVAGSFRAQIDDAHADARFAPAILVASDGTRAVAWTDGSGTPMQVRMARLSATFDVLGTSVISPDGGGAAPVIGLGEAERAFYFVEARIAMSAAHRVALGGDGTPGASTVARPLLRGADLPAIAVVRAPRGTRIHLAYAAVGNLATRAIGLVQSTGTDAPLPLVAGLGYGGALSLRAASLGASVVFAMEAPSAAEPSAPHEVRVRVAADDGTLGEPLVLAGQTAPDIAVLAEGVLAVSAHGARVTFLRCVE